MSTEPEAVDEFIKRSDRPQTIRRIYEPHPEEPISKEDAIKLNK